MRTQYFLPNAGYKGYTCYPEAFGHYMDPLHMENRTAGSFTAFNLHMVFKGKGYIFIHEKQSWVELSEGSGFLYGPGQVQQYRADPSDPWDIRWIHFSGHDLHQLLNGRGIGEVWVFSFGRQDRFLELTDELLRYGQSFESANEPRLSSILYEILAELALNAVNVQGQSLLNHHEKIRTTADYIQNHCIEPLTLTEMAAISGYSTWYFNRMFRQIMGKTPVQYVMESRITLAKQLLAASTLTVKQIGLQCGFANSSYFIYVFRKYEDVTPNQFRLSYPFG
ncbi:AraC-like DNA-binding protein [Paenibacillus sp. DS2015]|uniref:helix-turn-helix transcriptional regulator n=1 Tax=Paenibacillus sp. DS2015 TaxID=3373917 RepID=UPI003D25052B